VAAGNSGEKRGYGSITELASAKNVLSVGASDWASSQMAALSSMGPTADGRLKPEVMAPGHASHGYSQLGIARIRLLSKAGEPLVGWTFTSSPEGWRVEQGLQPPIVKDGELQTTTLGPLPLLKSPENLGIKAQLYSHLEITMRSSQHHMAILFWKTASTGSIAKQSFFFPINADGQMHSYTLDLSTHPLWKGTVQQLLLNPATTGLMVPMIGNSYSTYSGTSISAPITAGGLLLMIQAWRQTLAASSAARPSPALLKALLVATAQDMEGMGPALNPTLNQTPTPYPRGPDFATGYGQIHLGRAVELIRRAGKGAPGFCEGALLETGRRFNLRFRFKAVDTPQTLTLAWDDPPGHPGSERILQNDLDLQVKAPNGELLWPWLLDPAHPERAATRGPNHRDNLEQVPLGVPLSGTYVATVQAQELVQGPQGFALALSSAEGLEGWEIDAEGDSHCH
jgi:hypothetical protein